MSMNSIANAKSKKTIVVGERIIEQNPWRNDLIRREYQIAVEQALKDHKKKFPESSVEVITSFDNGPQEGFKLAEEKSSLAVVGYLYSTEAGEAAAFASRKKIPYLSPVSPLESVRTNYSFSLASSHMQMSQKFTTLAGVSDFSNPSIVVLPETQLSNFEYAKAYQDAFNVVETFKGRSEEIWNKLDATLKKLTKKSTVNVLFAGFAYEQLDLVSRLSSGPMASKVRLVGPPQWNYCPRLLSTTLSDKNKNIFLVSDYFNVTELPDIKVTVEKESMDNFNELASVLSKELKIKEHDPNEPIVYVLKDMINYALSIAEKSSDRETFNRLMGNGTFHGSSGTYEIKERVSTRKVYLGKWEKSKTIPVREL